MSRWKFYKRCLEIIFFVLIFRIYSFSHENKTIKVFFDCKKPCDIDFIKEEIYFVDMVREYYYADLYVSIDYDYLNSGGRRYVISFEPINNSTLNKKDINFTTERNDSQETIRNKLVSRIKVGLVDYLVDKPIIDDISINYEKRERVEKKQDIWKGWIFKFSYNMYANGDKNYKNLSMSGNLSASRTTKKEDVYFGYYQYFGSNKYKISSGFYKTETKSRSFSFNYTYAVSKHFGLGLFSSFGSSTYSNYDFRSSFCPAFEYSFFPYDESLRTKLKFKNFICGNYNDYTEETIYGKMREFLYKHSVSLIWEIKRKWGELENRLSYSYYLNLPSKHEFGINSSFSVNIGRGFAFNINGNYEIGNMDVNIIRRGLSLEEILLRTREMENNYSFYISFGISYSFGSIYSKEVNYVFD